MTSPLAPDVWLSGHLDKPCYRLEDGCECLSKRLRHLDDQGPSFVWARFPVKQTGAVNGLIRLGFGLVDVSVTLETTAQNLLARLPQTPKDGVEVRPAGPLDETALVAIGRAAFTHSRFHADPGIPAQTANAIYADWTANFFKGKRGDGMLVALAQGKPAGFLQYLLNPEAGLAVIDSIAVAQGHRSLGLGTALVRMLAEGCGQPAVRVGTQAANGAALAFYQRAGFGVAEHGLVLHRHG